MQCVSVCVSVCVRVYVCVCVRVVFHTPPFHRPLKGDKSFKSQEFYHLLDGLGWKVDPATHTGFKGKLHPLSEYTAGEMRPLAIGAQIPFKPFVYFADLTMEIAFVLPTLKQSRSTSSSSLRSTESVDSAADSE